jgi:hypothetical protein
LEKRRAVHDTRLEHFHHTGRVISFVGKANNIEDFRSWSSSERIKGKDQKRLPRTWLNRVLFATEFLTIIGPISVVISILSTLGILIEL